MHETNHVPQGESGKGVMLPPETLEFIKNYVLSQCKWPLQMTASVKASEMMRKDLDEVIAKCQLLTKYINDRKIKESSLDTMISAINEFHTGIENMLKNLKHDVSDNTTKHGKHECQINEIESKLSNFKNWTDAELKRFIVDCVLEEKETRDKKFMARLRTIVMWIALAGGLMSLFVRGHTFLREIGVLLSKL